MNYKDLEIMIQDVKLYLLQHTKKGTLIPTKFFDREIKKVYLGFTFLPSEDDNLICDWNICIDDCQDDQRLKQSKKVTPRGIADNKIYQGLPHYEIYKALIAQRHLRLV